MLAVWVILSVALVPVPLCYVLNTQPWMQEPLTLFCVGVALVTLVLIVPCLFVRREKNPDFILYVMSLFMLSSVVDLIIALEADGYIPSLMTFYLLAGEEYLWTAYGILTNYWDSTVHFSCCLWILFCINNGKSYRKVALFWVGSIVNSVYVLVLGSIIGKFSVKFAVLLNIPYLLIPLLIGYKLLASRETKASTEKSNRLVDLVFMMYFLVAMAGDFVRACIVLGCKLDLMEEYSWDHEPYLLHPVAYPKVQMLVYLMYFFPVYICFLYGLVFGRQPWLADWALLLAGAAAQGQFVHTGASLHYKTEPEFIVPDREHSRNVFWFFNILQFVGPILFALRENFRTDQRQLKQE